MKTKLKLFSVLALILTGLIAVSGIANADSVVPVSIESVEVNGEEVMDGTILGGIVRGDTLEVDVTLLATGDDNHIVIEASIGGLDHDSEKASDEIGPFTVKAGKTYPKTLELELPDRMDVEDYALRIEVSNKLGIEKVFNAVINIDKDRNKVIIKDVVFSPENQVKAGRALLTTVRVKNMGEQEEDVKIRISVPELGISASDYLDEVESEDSVTSEELYLRIPECAEAGQYTAVVSVEYDEGDEEVTESYLINVVSSDICNLGSADKTIIAVNQEAQAVTAGANGAVYPISIRNTASSAKTYTVSVDSGDWADVKISPNVAVINAGETEIVYVYVSAKDNAAEGLQTFDVTIKSGDETVKSVTLKASVEAGKGIKGIIGKVLQIALGIVIILVVLVALIIGFSKLRGDEDEELKEETYY